MKHSEKISLELWKRFGSSSRTMIKWMKITLDIFSEEAHFVDKTLAWYSNVEIELLPDLRNFLLVYEFFFAETMIPDTPQFQYSWEPRSSYVSACIVRVLNILNSKTESCSSVLNIYRLSVKDSWHQKQRRNHPLFQYHYVRRSQSSPQQLLPWCQDKCLLVIFII